MFQRNRRVLMCLALSLWAWTAAAVAQVATPTISPNGQVFGVAPNISLNCATSGSSIRYTTNGMDPTLSDPTYSGAFPLYQSAIVKAKAWVGSISSATASASFTVNGSLGAGADSAFAVRFDGIVQGWGNNANSKLGRTVSGSDPVPAPINTAAGSGTLTGVAMVTTGVNTGVALIKDGTVPNDGTVRTWGANGNYQLGINNTNASLTRAFAVTVVNAAGTLNGISMIASGGAHHLALAGSGTYAGQVWGWGKNADCQLAQPSSRTPEAFAVRIKSDATGNILSGVNSIAAGANFSMALKTDGTVWVWGDNSSYQSANNGNPDRGFPAVKIGLSNIKFIGAGANHCLAINTAGQLYVWGAGASGQLGNNATTAKVDAPYAIPGMNNVTMAEGGALHSLALKADGTVWAWGDNSNGQLGDGTITSRLTPVQVKTSSSTFLTGITAIACGDKFSMALGADGTVYVWGGNNLNQLALKGSPPPVAGFYATSGAAATYIETQLNKPPTSSVTASPTSASELASFTLTGIATDYNSLPATKMNFFVDGVLQGTSTTPTGTGSQQTFTLSSWTNVPFKATPYIVTAQATNSGGAVGGISPGTSVTVMRQSISLALQTASGSEGATIPSAFRVSRQAGNPTNLAVTVNYTVSGTATPGVDYTALSGSAIIPVGASYVDIPITALTDRLVEGTETVVLTVASGNYQFAGSPVTFTITDVPPVSTPTFYPPSGTKAKINAVWIDEVDPGTTIYYTTTSDGSVPPDPIPGSSAQLPSGQNLLKLNSLTRIKTLAVKAGFPNSDIASASYTGAALLGAGYDQSFAVLSDGALWQWGSAQSGLGLGFESDGTTPKRLIMPGITPGITNPLSFSGNQYQSYILKSDGTVSATGDTYNTFGDGSTTSSMVWVNVANLSNGIQLSCSREESHALLLKADHTVVSWGTATAALGRPYAYPANQTAAPVVLSSGLAFDHVVQVEAGNYASYFLRDDGTVWICGYDAGSGTTYANPVQVSGLVDIVEIAAGYNHALALKKTGQVYVWGINNYGQFGVSTPSSSSLPILSGFTNAISIAAGTHTSYVINKVGGVLATGGNEVGQLGIGTQFDSFVPAALPVSKATRVNAGDAHALAFIEDGGLVAWGWGGNDRHQVGIGGYADCLFPVQVALSYEDTDGDGLQDWYEKQLGTDPTKKDTNGDGLTDLEDLQRGINPVLPDIDGDGLTNAQEVVTGTNPLTKDSDKDGVNDNLDAFPNDPTRTVAPVAIPGDTVAPTIQITAPSGVVLTP